MGSDGAAGAMAAQAAVQRLVEAVKEGNVSQFKAASKALDGGPEGVKGVRDSYGRGMLHYAAQFGHTKVIQHLVDTCNMDVNEQDSAGEPPLALAAATGKEAAAKLLLSLGADPSLRKDLAATAPVHRAATASENGGKAPGVLSLLLEDPKVRVDTPSSTGTPLCWAAGAGNIGAVRLLLSKGADPNDAGCGSEPMPALSLAVASSSTACVDALIAAGAKVGTTGRGGATALHVAAAMSNPDSAVPCANVEALLKAGADPNVCDRSGLTPLEVAIAAGNLAVATLLFPLTKPKAGVEPWDMEHLIKHVQEAVKTMGQAEGSQGRDVKISIPEAPQPDKEQAAAWKRKGDVAFVGKEYDTAADAYSQSLLHDTQNAVVWANRAAAFLKLEQARDALMDAQRSRTLDPKYDKAWYREGAAYEMLLDWENAAAAYYEGCNLQQSSANADFEAAFKRVIKRGQEEYQAKQQAGKA